MRRWFAVGALAVAVGCGHDPFLVRPRLAPSALSISVTGSSATSADGMIFVADTHASNPLAAHRAISDGTGIGERLTHVAVRPPHMDIWGQAVLAWILDRNKDARVVIHLGDAANIGCTNEFERFLALMARLKQPWVMAPGNHDSLMLGNFSIDRFEGFRWSEECQNRSDGADEHMDKNELIRRYTAAQGWTLLPRVSECTELARPIEAMAAPGVERAIACVYDDSPHISFLMQQVAINAQLTVIVLDTAVYAEPPSLTEQGGTQGGIGVQQGAILQEWLEEEAHRAKSRSVLLAGHFALDHLDVTSQRQLARIVGAHDVLGYISAHEHDPTKQLLHADPKDDHRTFPELNIASTLDWPMEYVRAAFVEDVKSRKLQFEVVSVARELDGVPDSNCSAIESWRVPHDDDDQVPYSYTAYVPYHWYRSLAFWTGNPAYAMLRTNMYKRLELDLGLSDPAVRVISDGELHGGMPGDDARLARYERCQARWASEEESHTRYGRYGKEIVWRDPTRATRVLPEGQPRSTVVWTWRR